MLKHAKKPDNKEEFLCVTERTWHFIGFTDDQVEELKAEMQSKYDVFDEEKQANIDDTFVEAFGVLDKSIVDGDYDSVKAQFEDAGASEEFDAVLKAPGLKESYNVFRSAFMTMGNSED